MTRKLKIVTGDSPENLEENVNNFFDSNSELKILDISGPLVNPINNREHWMVLIYYYL